MRASSEASAERGRQDGSGQGGPRGKLAEAGPGHWAGRRLTPLGGAKTLLQLHAPELQGVQLALDVLHVSLDLFRGHVVRVQLGTKGR